MQTRPVQLTDVIYNAATQSFEAVVTVHESDRSRKYACAITAPITMSFEEAAEGLRRQAERRHAGRGGMYSEVRSQAPLRRATRTSFDPKRWLETLLTLPGRKAA